MDVVRLRIWPLMGVAVGMMLIITQYQMLLIYLPDAFECKAGQARQVLGVRNESRSSKKG